MWWCPQGRRLLRHHLEPGGRDRGGCERDADGGPAGDDVQMVTTRQGPQPQPLAGLAQPEISAGAGTGAHHREARWPRVDVAVPTEERVREHLLALRDDGVLQIDAPPGHRLQARRLQEAPNLGLPLVVRLPAPPHSSLEAQLDSLTVYVGTDETERRRRCPHEWDDDRENGRRLFSGRLPPRVDVDPRARRTGILLRELAHTAHGTGSVANDGSRSPPDLAAHGSRRRARMRWLGSAR